MNLPTQAPGAYAFAFLIWGAASGQWLAALAAAALLELPRLTGRTVRMDDRFYRAAWLLALVIEWILAINAWLEPNRIQAIRGLLQWTPFAVLPLAFVSAAAKNPGVPMSALLLILRKHYNRPTSGGVVVPAPRVDPFFPMICLVLLAASYLAPGAWFFPAICAMFAWIHLHERAGRGGAFLPAWLAAAVVLAFGLQWGIHRAYEWLDELLMLGGNRATAMETSRTVTRIGSIDEIKNSGAVKWRARIPQDADVPLLREATYNFFRRNMWVNTHLRQFSDLPHDDEATPHESWLLADAALSDLPPVAVRGRADPDYTVLPLAAGAARLERLPSFIVQRNGLGVTRAESAVPVLNFEMRMAAAPVSDRPPNETDLEVPDDLHPTLRAMADELGLPGMDAQGAVDALQMFFASRFRYTRRLKGDSVREFLETGREGHCEYFASAGGLLLRAAGIPTRYNTGFAVQEYDERSDTWLLRGIHAHAWNSAWINGRWQDVDFTPPGWLDADSKQLPFWQPLADWWEVFSVAFLEWRASNNLAERGRFIAPIGIALAVLYTAVRLWMGRRREKAAGGKGAHIPRYRGENPRTDWIALLPALESKFGARPAWLPPVSWVESWSDAPDELGDAARQIARAHYIARFAPAGVFLPDDASTSAATERVRAFLEREQGGKTTGQAV